MKKNLTLSGNLGYIFQGLTLIMLAMLVPQLGHAQSTSVVISEVYGGGGNAGAPYDHDFVELYNKTGAGIDLNGYSVQYNPATGGGNYNTVPLGNVTIPANGFLLVQFGATGTIGAALPTPSVINALDLSATGGRVALVNNVTPLKNSDQANELGAGIIDFVGYGSSASAYEGASQAPAPSNSTSIERKARIDATSVSMALGGDDANQGNGYDSNNNNLDFVTRAAPMPQNSASSLEVLNPIVVYYSNNISNPTGKLDVLTTFSDKAAGDGNSPTSFVGSHQLFIIVGAGRTIASNWTVSGVGSKVIVQAGSTFTEPATANFTGLLDLESGSTLVELNPTPAVTFGSVNAASTIEYAQATTYTVPLLPVTGGPGYGNLTLRNATKRLATGTSVVRGNLLVSNVGATDSNIFGGATTPTYPNSVLNLGGNLTLAGTVKFSADGTDRISLVTTNLTTPQVLIGGSNAIKLYKLTLPTGQAGVSLASGTSNLELGDSNGGGYQLATGTVLTVNDNLLSFVAGGGASIASDAGALALSSSSSLSFSKNSSTVLGTLRLTPGSTQLANLTLNAVGGVPNSNSLTLPVSLTVNGALTLTNGTLSIGNNTLTLNGEVTSSSTGGQFKGSTTASLVVGGSNTVATVAFFLGSEILNSLTLNRPNGTLALQGKTLQVKLPTLISGVLSIGAGMTLTIMGALVVANSSVAQFAGTPTSGLVFMGTGPMGDVAFVEGQNQIDNLTMYRSRASARLVVPTVQLMTSLTVNSLTLTSGKIFLPGTNKLILLPGIGPPSGNTNSYVNTLTAAAMTNLTTPRVSLVFPLGVNGQFRQLTLSVVDLITGTGTTSYTARQIEGPSPVRTLPATLLRVSRIRYYNVVSESGGTSTLQSATVKLNYNYTNDLVTRGSQSYLRVAMTDPTNSSRWVDIGGSATGSTITSASFAAGPLGDFILATNTETPVNTNPLPVELVRFEAVRQTDAVRLTWATASEKNSAFFDVQRSLDGQAFATVLSTAAQGNSTQPSVYAGLDSKAPASRLYYRLRQVDLDGAVAYSTVVTVAGTDATLTELVVYPNPTAGRLTATLPAASGRTYRVLNTLGQVQRQGLAEVANPAVEVGQLPAGLYFLELRTATGLQVRRFIKKD